MTYGALPGAGGAVQRGVQEVHAPLKEHNVAVLAFEQASLVHVIGEHIIQAGEAWDGGRVLHGFVLGLP